MKDEKTNLIAKRALELIKEDSYTLDEYKENLQHTINVLHNELNKEMSGEILREQELNKFVEEKNGEAIYKIFKAGAKGYNIDVLINAVIKTGDADAIISSVCIWKNERITRTHFLKCAKALVELKATEEIVHFSKYCFGDYSGYNTFNIAEDLIHMMEQDLDLMEQVIEHIDTMKKRQGNTPSCYMPYGTAVTSTMWKFRNLVSNVYINKKYFKEKSEV